MKKDIKLVETFLSASDITNGLGDVEAYKMHIQRLLEEFGLDPLRIKYVSRTGSFLAYIPYDAFIYGSGNKPLSVFKEIEIKAGDFGLEHPLKLGSDSSSSFIIEFQFPYLSGL